MALTLLAANNAQTVLAAGINSTATSLTVNTGTGDLFPSPVAGASFFKLTLVDAATGTLTEIVHVTARSGDTMTIERGQEGTPARAWSANDIAANMMTAGSFALLAQTALSLQVANNLSEIASAGPSAVSQTLTNLGLGTAATKNVGTGSNQIPDMSSFTASRASTGWQKLPGGLIIQWGQASTDTSSLVTVAYPIPFPNSIFQVIGSCLDVNNANIVAINSTDGVNFNLVAWVATSGSVLRTKTPVKWIAIGN
ncbi:gp53-like domain-containing protein [Enterobacter sp. TMH.L2]